MKSRDGKIDCRKTITNFEMHLRKYQDGVNPKI